MDGPIVLWKWTGLTETDTAVPVVVPNQADKSVQIMGNFGAGGEVTVQGALDPAAADGDFVALSDPQGNALAFTGLKLEAVLENTYLMRPKVTGGTGVAVDVWVLIR